MEELSFSNGLRSTRRPSYDSCNPSHLTFTGAYFRHYFPALWRIYSTLSGATTQRTDAGLVDAYVLKTTGEAAVDSHTVLDKLRTADARDPQRPALLSASECMDHLAAGIDTTGDGLCFLLHRLSQPATYPTQAALRAELAAHTGRGPAALDALPYLDAVCRETLRLYVRPCLSL